MSTVRGISLDSYATIASDCTMNAEVRGHEIQLELGPSNSLLNVVTDVDGLRKLGGLINQVLIRYDAVPDPENNEFRIDHAR